MMYRLIKWLSQTVAVIMWHCSVSQTSSRLVAWCRKADSVTICDRQAGLFDKHQSRSCWCRRHAASEAAASVLRRVYRSGEIRLARPRAASRPHYCHTTRQTRLMWSRRRGKRFLHSIRHLVIWAFRQIRRQLAHSSWPISAIWLPAYLCKHELVQK